MKVPPLPHAFTVVFHPNSSVLLPNYARVLGVLSSRLANGAYVTVVGFGRGNAGLARARAYAVIHALRAHVANLHVRLILNTGANVQWAKMIPTRQ